MIKSSLMVGDFYKNYPELCNALGVTVQFGNAKKAQLVEWSRFFKWKRKGQGYEITEIYDTPKPKEKGRKKPSKYAFAAYKILLYKFYKRYKANPNDIPAITLKKNQLISLLGFTDCLYRKIETEDSDKHILSELRDDCMEVMFGEISRIVKNLCKTKVMRFTDRYYIETADGERVANDEEERIIELKLALYFNIFRCKNMHDVFSMKKEKKFYDELNKDLLFYGFTYKCGAYEIQLECNGEQTNIENAYAKIFGSMTQQEAEKYVDNQRLFLHEHIRNYVSTANRRYVKRMKTMFPYAFEYYKQKREFFTSRLIKLL